MGCDHLFYAHHKNLFPFPPFRSKCNPFCRHLLAGMAFQSLLQFESKILPSDNEQKWEQEENLIFLTPSGWLIQKNKKKLDKRRRRRWWRQEHSGFTPTHSLRDNKVDKIDQKLNFPSEWQRNKGTCHLLCNTNSSESIGKTKDEVLTLLRSFHLENNFHFKFLVVVISALRR